MNRRYNFHKKISERAWTGKHHQINKQIYFILLCCILYSFVFGISFFFSFFLFINILLDKTKLLHWCACSSNEWRSEFYMFYAAQRLMWVFFFFLLFPTRPYEFISSFEAHPKRDKTKHRYAYDPHPLASTQY